MQIIVGLLIFTVLVAMFISSYLLNKKTKAPEGITPEECGGCNNIRCTHKQGGF